jgi:site-specific DNA-methyltransferase (adenine-specific)
MTEITKIDDLIPDSNNANKGTARGAASIRASIQKNGAGRSILLDRNGKIIAGNKTAREAASAGMEDVIVIKTDGSQLVAVQRTDLDLTTDKSARELAYADNRTAEIDLAWDPAIIAADIENGISLCDLWEDDETRKLIASIKTQTASESAPVTPDQVTTRCRQGDMWTLGDHKLLCGDSRESAAVAKILENERIQVCVTSPPYASQRAYDASSGFQPIRPDEYAEWYQPIQENIARHIAPGGSYFLNIKEHCHEGQRHLYVKKLIIQHVEQWEWLFVDEFCWRDTRNGVPGGWNNRFKDGWEPVFHFSASNEWEAFCQFSRHRAIKFRPEAVSTPSDAVFNYSPDNQKSGSSSGLLGHEGRILEAGIARPSNVIEAAAETTQREHTAPFPITLPLFFIKAFSDESDIVYEPFAGSGTTLIAAERTNRRCRAIELSPAYCDVIIARWESETGLTAEVAR